MSPERPDAKTRILHAARDEFAEFGLAGARIDRIAVNADANKALIYRHFGSKSALFDTVVYKETLAFAEIVEWDPSDMAVLAGRMIDALWGNQTYVRILMWATLERDTPYEESVEDFKVRLSLLPPEVGRHAVDVSVLAMNLVAALSANPSIVRPGGATDDEQRMHRIAVVSDAMQAVMDVAARTP